MMRATLVNAIAVLFGGGIGLLLQHKISQGLSQNLIRAIGLCVCIIGVSGALNGDFMLLVVSLAIGALIGELLKIEDCLSNFGLWLQKKLPHSKNRHTFSQGFVTASLLFCVGAMSIVGSIESGLNHNYQIIFTKSVLDGISAMILASTFGFGVLFSAMVILIYQGSMELCAGFMQTIVTDALTTQISAVGSVMILGIGFNMAAGAKIKTANLLPSLLVAIGYYCFTHL